MTARLADALRVRAGEGRMAALLVGLIDDRAGAFRSSFLWLPEVRSVLN